MTQAYQGSALRRAALHRVLRRAAMDRAQQAALRRTLQRASVSDAAASGFPDAELLGGGAPCR